MTKFTYSGQGIAFDGKIMWSYDSGFARNVVIFGVDNISSFHNDHQKSKFSVLWKGLIKVIKDSVGAAAKNKKKKKQKKNSINFSKVKIVKFALQRC